MDSKKRWFIDNSGQITGPYEDSEVEALIGGISHPLIWGRGMNEWLAPSLWRQAAIEIIKTEAINPKELFHWKYRYQGQESELMTYQTMIGQLKKLRDVTSVELWADSFTGWKDIYKVRSVIDDLGISRRMHARVAIVGSLTIDTASGPTQFALSNISEGGLGLVNQKSLKIGDKIKGHVTSKNLSTDFNCSAEIVYTGTDGYTGIRFLNLPIEAKSIIIEYVKKFKNLKT